MSGISTLEKYARVLRNDRIKAALKKQNHGVKVHPSCQKNLGNSIRKRKNDNLAEKRAAKSKAPKKTRLSLGPFNWKKQCFFCGEECHADDKHPDRKQFYNVTFVHYRDTVLNLCEARDDEWSEKVRSRVVNCIDLVQADAIYHAECSKLFQNTEKLQASQGRPKNTDKQRNFEVICEWLETDAELQNERINKL